MGFKDRKPVEDPIEAPENDEINAENINNDEIGEFIEIFYDLDLE